MALIIPSNYHKISDVEKNHISWIEPELAKRQDIRPLRIGILNIMPLGKQYEFNLLHPLGLSPLQIEPVWIKLKTHSYKTWDLSHLNCSKLNSYCLPRGMIFKIPILRGRISCLFANSGSIQDI